MRWQDENNKFTGAPLSLSLVVVVRVCVSQADYCMNNCVRTMNWPLLASYSLFSQRLIHIRIALEAIHISENSSICAKRTMTDEWKWITLRGLCMIIQVCPCPFVANMTSDTHRQHQHRPSFQRTSNWNLEQSKRLIYRIKRRWSASTTRLMSTRRTNKILILRFAERDHLIIHNFSLWHFLCVFTLCLLCHVLAICFLPSTRSYVNQWTKRLKIVTLSTWLFAFS